ncbi:MAG: YqhA family protein [Verrucomicrobiota bacterium]
MQKKLERAFEGVLWNSRFIVLLAVIFGIISAFAVFGMGTWDIVVGIGKMLAGKLDGSAYLVGVIIGAIDLYLIGVVLLIFSFGIYELFISQLDIGRANKEVQILEITSLDELKNRIIKVVIMVLVVTFFKKILAMEFTTPLDMLYFALSIFAISFGVYFMHKAH